MEDRGFIEIGFKRYRLFLLVPNRNQPVDRQGAGKQTNRHPGVFKPVSAEAEVSLQARGAEPMGFEHPSFVRTGGLNPTQGHRTLLSVIAGEQQIPKAQQGCRAEHVKDE